MSDEWIEPDWPAPPGVRAVVTTRLGGHSRHEYATLNLGDHVGDDYGTVCANREWLQQQLDLPSAPFWLRQVHGTDAVELPGAVAEPRADAGWTRHVGVVCAVMTADCLPVLLADREGRCVAAVHAGWRGLEAGVVESALAALPTAATHVQAWIGPAIGARHYEVGEEVRSRFVSIDPGFAVHFQAGREGHWLADLPAICRQRLRHAGVHGVYGGDLCTYSDPARFYSYRRDGRTGRFASLIWLDPS